MRAGQVYFLSCKTYLVAYSNSVLFFSFDNDYNLLEPVIGWKLIFREQL